MTEVDRLTVIERWWMLRYPTGTVRMATEQGDDAGNKREEEAREVGARLFRVVREEQLAGAVKVAEAAKVYFREFDHCIGSRDEHDYPERRDLREALKAWEQS